MKTMYIEDKKEKGKRIKKKLLHISLKKNISPLHSGQKNITLLNNISFLNTTSSLFSKSSRSSKFYYPSVSNTNRLPLIKQFQTISTSAISKNSFNEMDGVLGKLKSFYKASNSNVTDANSSELSKYIQKPKVSKDESKEINRFLLKSYKDAQLTVNVNEEFYSNPKTSLKVLKENKAINEEMSYVISRAQTELYENQYKTIVSKTHLYKKVPKIKISIIPPKDVEIDSLIKQNKHISSNKITDELVRNKLLISNKYYHCYNLKQNSSNPNARTEPTFINVEHLAHTLFLFGGLSTCPLFDFWSYDVKQHLWKKIFPKGENFLPRYGHSCAYYKGNIYIYGGTLQKNKLYPIEDILCFNYEKNTIKALNFKKTKVKPIWRRNHICHVASSLMIVHGGIGVDEFDESRTRVLNDFLALDLNTLAWVRMPIEYRGKNIKKSIMRKSTMSNNNNLLYSSINTNKFELKLAYHASCIVLSKENQLKENLNIYRFDYSNTKTQLKYEGIYIFGGMDEYGECNNDVYILIFGSSPLTVFKPDISGKRPPKRYSCSMNYFEELNYIVIYGGKNSESLNDIYILDVVNFLWIEVELFGCENVPRCEHVGTICGTRLVIFGGCNETSFIPAKIFGIDLDLFGNQRLKEIYDHAKENIAVDKRDRTAANVLQMLEEGPTIPSDTYLFLGGE